MNVTIIAVGSYGDVQPYVALGLGLRDAGHQVRIATHGMFQSQIRGRGLEFSALAGDFRALLASQQGGAFLHRSGNAVQFSRHLVRLLAPLMRHLARDCWSASHDAEALMVNPLGLLAGFHVAEKQRVPLIRAYYVPVSPSRAPLGEPRRHGRPAGVSLHLLAHLLVRQVFWLLVRPLANGVRRDALDLPPLGLRQPFGRLDAERQLLLYGFSPTLVPRPPDWGPWVHVTGYWFLDRPADWQPPQGLVDFLEAGPPPVYVGFGSMVDRDARATTRVVLEALRQAGRRGVLQAAWGGLSPADLPGNVYAADVVPYDWLFPRVAAVVHHGGSGTTHCGLRAGVPSIVVPFFADQPFWASRVHALGVGPPPIPRRELSPERLAQALRVAEEDAVMRRRAADVGRCVQSENGVARAVEAFNRHVADLPARPMRPDAASRRAQA